MNKYLKWTLFVVGGLVLVAFVGLKVMTANTKKASPEQTVTFNEGAKHVEVFYNRPSKKGREIFGGLVPYGEVWRTGANEATTFTTETELVIDGKMLPAGKYTLWTIPEQDKWTVIFNNKQYDWGINWDGTPVREAEADVLKVQVPTQVTNSPVEMFTISFDQSIPAMEMAWDMTKISVPIK